MTSDEHVELYCECIKETDNALYCDFGNTHLWVPKSIVHDDSEVYQECDAGEMVIPLWFVEKEGLI